MKRLSGVYLCPRCGDSPFVLLTIISDNKKGLFIPAPLLKCMWAGVR